MHKLTEKAIRYRRTDGRTEPNYRKASLLKKGCNVCLSIFIKTRMTTYLSKQSMTYRPIGQVRVSLQTAADHLK